MIGKLNAILHDQKIPDEASVPMHAHIEYMAKPCPNNPKDYYSHHDGFCWRFLNS